MLCLIADAHLLSLFLQKFAKFFPALPKQRDAKHSLSGSNRVRGIFTGVPHPHSVEMEGWSGRSLKRSCIMWSYKHTNFDDPLYNKCAHGNIEPRKMVKSWYDHCQDCYSKIDCWWIICHLNQTLAYIRKLLLFSLGSVVYERLCEALTNNALV